MAVRLSYHALKGDLKKVKKCIKNGVDVDACESSGNSALFHAAQNDRQECVKYLLTRGAKPNRINKEGLTPVNAACCRDNVKCLALLVQYGGSLDQVSPHQKESATVSAYKYHSSEVIKFINMLRNEALTKDGLDLLETSSQQSKQTERNAQQITDIPGLSAVLLHIYSGELKASSKRVSNDLPQATLRNALWHMTPVTVKQPKRGDGSAILFFKEADTLSRLRHPRLALLMAVCVGPRKEHLCLVLEPFEFGSLNHLLHKTHKEIDLPERVHILQDVSEGMTYLHSHLLLHCFLNSFSVLISGTFRAKIGNLEYSQENIQGKPADTCEAHENWMSPEQLFHAPATIAGDVYSFGVLMWEILARQVPWSWLTHRTIKQALCEDKTTLPLMELWPSYIECIMTECFQDPTERSSFDIIQESLVAIKDRGKELTSKALDAAFPGWYQANYKDAYMCRECSVVMKSLTVLPHRSVSSSEPLKCKLSQIQVMVRRNSSHCSEKARRSTIGKGLVSTLKALSQFDRVSSRQKDIERYGQEIAEQLAFVRGVRKHARNYTRSRWAKEVVLTRKLEGDIERVRRREIKETEPRQDHWPRRFSQRLSSVRQKEIERLQETSSRFSKKEWSKLSHCKEQLRFSMSGFKSLVKKDAIEGDKAPLDELNTCCVNTALSLNNESTDGEKEVVQLQWVRKQSTASSNLGRESVQHTSQIMSSNLGRESVQNTGQIMSSNLGRESAQNTSQIMNSNSQITSARTSPPNDHNTYANNLYAIPDKSRAKPNRVESANNSSPGAHSSNSQIASARPSHPNDHNNNLNNLYAIPDKSRAKSNIVESAKSSSPRENLAAFETLDDDTRETYTQVLQDFNDMISRYASNDSLLLENEEEKTM